MARCGDGSAVKMKKRGGFKYWIDARPANPFRLPRLHPGSCFVGLAPARGAPGRVSESVRGTAAEAIAN
jgi:hypothetical protein